MEYQTVRESETVGGNESAPIKIKNSKTVSYPFKKICIYNRSNATYIVDSTGKDENCPEIGLNNSRFKSSFYALDPDYRPIPSYMYIVSMTLKKDWPYDVLNTFYVYDPYQARDPNSIEFITWLTPVPHTKPLYIYKGNIGNYISFDKQTDMEEAEFSPIYVFKDKPVVTFTNDMNRCIPDEGSSLGIAECAILTRHLKPQSLLDYITDLQMNKKKSGLNLKYLGENSESNNIYVYVIVFLVILVIWGLIRISGGNRLKWG